MNIFKITLGTILLGGMIATSSCRTETQKGSDATHEHHNHNHPVVVEETSAGTAEITFDNLEFDFGTINEGEKVSHTYNLTNSGSVPLVIQNASPSCGCTVPDWPKEPIAPGESGKIEVTFDSNGKTNTQNRTVSIVANTEPTITYLRIRGTVIPKANQAMGPVRKN